MAETFTFSDPDVGMRFTIENRFVPGPKAEPTAQILIGRVASAYLAAAEEDDRMAILSLSSVEVDGEMTRERLEQGLAVQNAHAAELAGERGWTIHRPYEAVEVAGYPAMRNEFVAQGGIDAGGDPTDEETHPAGHVQACTVYLEGHTLSIMLGVHPPGDLERARGVMDLVLGSLEILGTEETPQSPREEPS